MLVTDLLHNSLYYVEICSLYSHCLDKFCHKQICWILSKGFHKSIEMITWFLFFNLLEFLSGGPVVWTWHFHCSYLGLIPGQRTKILQVMKCSQKRKKKRKKKLLCITLFEFSLLIFCYGFWHVCSSVIWTYKFLFFVTSLFYFSIR